MTNHSPPHPVRSKNHTTSRGATKLRRRAEQRLQGQHAAKHRARIEADAQRLVHELQVHQVELELQNAELLEARARAEAMVEKYTELYDFAPVGYFSLTASGRIKLVNLAGARLVGLERARLVGQTLAQHIASDSRSAFRDFLERVFADESRQSCEVTLARASGPPRTVSIDGERWPD